MKYAKLIDGYPHYAPNPLIVDSMTVANPTEAMLRDAGYLPVVTSEPPKTDDLHYPESAWEQMENEIRQAWAIKELPPQEPEGLEPRVTKLEDDMAAIQTAYMEGVNNA